MLFADLKGSMELLADRDPEEARKLLDPVLERMMEAVHRYEGTVNQVMGDGIMALFGAPLAHEDHAVRACYAALRMQERSRSMRRVSSARTACPSRSASGSTPARSSFAPSESDLRMDYTAVGQTTHLAARMEQMATPGIDPPRRCDRSSSPRATCRSSRLGARRGQGPGRSPWRSTSSPERAPRGPGSSGRRAGLDAFVGRDAEVEQLRRALARTHDADTASSSPLVGEPGVGKSRLVDEFTHSHRTQGWLILEAAPCRTARPPAYLPIIDLLKAYFKFQDRDDPPRDPREGDRQAPLRSTGPRADPARLAGPARCARRGRPWQALDPPQRRQRTLDAVKRLLLRESQVQPLLAGLRGPALDRCRDAGPARRPGREPAHGAAPPPGQLSARSTSMAG